MWFKSIYPFKFENTTGDSWAICNDADRLAKELATKPFSPCAQTQRESMGWLPPISKDGGAFTHEVNGCILFTFMHQEKSIPASVLKDAMKERVDTIQREQGRIAGNQERKTLRDEIEMDLLPHAFPKNTRVDAWIDRRNGWLLLNTSGAPVAERFTKMLRKTLGSLPVTLLETEMGCVTKMNHFLGVVDKDSRTYSSDFSESMHQNKFLVGHYAEMKGYGDDKASAVFKNHELSNHEVLEHLNTKNVIKIGLEWDEKVSFVMMEDYVLKSVKFLDVMQEALNDEEAEDYEQLMDIQFSLMSGEVSGLLNNLINVGEYN